VRILPNVPFVWFSECEARKKPWQMTGGLREKNLGLSGYSQTQLDTRATVKLLETSK
jgi:hypothetical protein